MIWIIGWAIVSCIIIVAGMCMANIKLVKNGECSGKFVRDVFIAGTLWPIPVVALVWMTLFFNKEQLDDVFDGLDL